MKKFVFIFCGIRAGNMSDEEKKALRDKWMAWFGTIKDHVVDGGNPFLPGAKSVTAHSVETIADKVPAISYTIISAEDMDEATKIAQGAPVLEGSEGAVRVYEVLPM